MADKAASPYYCLGIPCRLVHSRGVHSVTLLVHLLCLNRAICPAYYIIWCYPWDSRLTLNTLENEHLAKTIIIMIQLFLRHGTTNMFNQNMLAKFSCV